MPDKSFAEGEICQLPSALPPDLTFFAAGMAKRELDNIKNALASWAQLVRNEANPVRQDSAELAGLAFRRWSYYRKGLDVASSLNDLRAKIRNNPKAEVAVLLLARARRRRESRVRMGIVGVSLFRRTWSNNIFLDFLAKHPYTAVERVGTALLWYIARIASALDASAIWGETTQNSVEYYNALFGTQLTDLLYVERKIYEQFCSQLEGTPNEDHQKSTAP